jgi:single-stranded-DNA-specific exonuclease
MTWETRFERDQNKDLVDQIIHHRFPNTVDLDDPVVPSWAALPEIKRAVKRVQVAAEKNERVLVVGDADADGTTATAMMVLTLRNLGIETFFFIPNRLTDGYGFGIEAVSEAKRVGATLIITVDCGTTGVEAARRAKDDGIYTIVFDHHNLGDKRPDVYALVNPRVTRSSVCFQDYVSSSLVMLFFHALGVNGGQNAPLPGDAMNEEMVRTFWALSAIATVTDVASVMEENRVILTRGFQEIATTKFSPLLALKDLLDKPRFDYHDIGWEVGPLFNAPGRMGHPDTVVRFLTAQKRDGDSVQKCLQQMETYNRRRRDWQGKALPEAREMAEGLLDRYDPPVLVVAGDWHLGVLGIVAGRLAEEFKRPAIVLAQKGDEYRGSGRSYGGFDLHGHLVKAQEISGNKYKFGGHSAAIGITVHAMDLFVATMLNMDVKIPKPQIKYDAEVPFPDIHSGTISRLSVLSPHGPGNPWPAFVTRNVKVIQASTDHFGCNGLVIQGDMPLRFASKCDLKPKNSYDILFIPRFATPYGKRVISLEVLDFRPS